MAGERTFAEQAFTDSQILIICMIEYEGKLIPLIEVYVWTGSRDEIPRSKASSSQRYISMSR